MPGPLLVLCDGNSLWIAEYNHLQGWIISPELDASISDARVCVFACSDGQKRRRQRRRAASKDSTSSSDSDWYFPLLHSVAMSHSWHCGNITWCPCFHVTFWHWQCADNWCRKTGRLVGKLNLFFSNSEVPYPGAGIDKTVMAALQLTSMAVLWVRVM